MPTAKDLPESAMCLERRPIVLLVNPIPAASADLVRDIESRGYTPRQVGNLAEALAVLGQGDVTSVVFDARRSAMTTSAIAAGVGAAYPWLDRVWLHGEGQLPIVASAVRQLLGDPVSVDAWTDRSLGPVVQAPLAGVH